MNEQSVELNGEVDIVLEAEESLYFELMRVLARYIQPGGGGTLREDEVRDVFDNVMARFL